MPYSIDSSGILDAFRYYPPDVFPTIWKQMDHAAENGLIFAADEIYKELERKDDSAFRWLKRHKVMIVSLDEDVQRRVIQILGSHQRLVDTRKNRSGGDPFVIGLALSRGLTVVTGEKPSGVIAKPNIPDVCSVLGLSCLSVLELFRKEGWRA